MSYTVWYRGELLGESPLDFIRWKPCLRVGFLHATPQGEKILQVAGGTCAAAIELSRALQRQPEADRETLPEYAAFIAAMENSHRYELELRDADGVVIPTNDVSVRDFGDLERLKSDHVDEMNDFHNLDDADDSRLAADVNADLELLSAAFADDWDATWDPVVDAEERLFDFDEEEEPWRARDERAPRPASRYQLQVELIDDLAIP